MGNGVWAGGEGTGWVHVACVRGGSMICNGLRATASDTPLNPALEPKSKTTPLARYP